MLITVKVRYGCSKQMVENFGNDRYLVYLLSRQDETDAMEELVALISRKLGVPPLRIVLKQDKGTDKVFELF